MRFTLFLLFPVIIFLACSNGPEKTAQRISLPQNSPVTQGNPANDEPEIIIPAGTDPYASFRCSLTDKAGNVWLGTTGAGIYRYNAKEKSFTNFTAKDGLTNLTVYSLSEDSAGTLWAGTQNGAFRFTGNAFTRFYFPGETKNPLEQRLPVAVFSIAADKSGNVWFGTEHAGLCCYNASAQTVTGFGYDGYTWHEMSPDSLKYYDKTTNEFIQCILVDTKGNSWFSAVGKACSGLFRYDPQAKIVAHIPLPNLAWVHIFSMTEDKAGNIWMATRDNGVCRYDPNSTGEKSFTFFEQPNDFCDRGAHCMITTENGNVWACSVGNMGTDGGCVTVYDGKSFTPFSTAAWSNNRTWTMTEDHDGTIWFGTRELGLYRYDPKVSGEKSFTKFN